MTTYEDAILADWERMQDSEYRQALREVVSNGRREQTKRQPRSPKEAKPPAEKVDKNEYKRRYEIAVQRNQILANRVRDLEAEVKRLRG